MNHATPEPTAVGSQLEHFDLPDTEGGRGSSRPGQDAAYTVVVFTCNHCPYAIAWQGRIAAVASDYADRGVRVVAVNSNDAERYPRDSFEAMQQRVRDEGWSIPYLHDASQEVASKWGAKTTPDLFVVDATGTLLYRGAPDSDYSDESQDANWLREGLDDLLANRPVSRPRTDPVGCSIKWKQ